MTGKQLATICATIIFAVVVAVGGYTAYQRHAAAVQHSQCVNDRDVQALTRAESGYQDPYAGLQPC